MTLTELTFDDRGLVPVVAQDAASGEVLTLAYANLEALEKTLETRQAHYWSRSRGELWRKGATSGNVQEVLEIRLDCDTDAVLYRVRPAGPACHTGAQSCFHNPITPEATPAIGELMTLLERVVDRRIQEQPEGSYVARLHQRGIGYVAQKVIEEAGESVVAALQQQDQELVGEAADLLFHLVVLLRERGIGLEQVAGELAERHREKTQTQG